jgi:type II secretory pathway pseudopilin PulG
MPRKVSGMSKKCAAGISLVELLIILAIISIAAAIAIPSIMMSRQIANESGAIGGCRLIASAQLAYAAMQDGEYGDLPALVEAELLDPKYTGVDPVGGYRFTPGDVEGTTVDGMPPASFGFIATPERGSGRYVYAIAPDGIVRYQGTVRDYTLPEGLTPGSPVEELPAEETTNP